MPGNKKIQITDAGENNLFPHTSLDNLQVSKSDNTPVTLATEIGATGSTAAIPTERAVRQALDEKQDNFAADENVSTEASNGVSLEVSSAGVLGVHADKTSASGFGTVKVGTNITVNDGVISIPDASTSEKGVVRIDTTAGNGVALTIDGGTAGVHADKASAEGFGTVKVGTNITVNDGVISIPDASASAKGVVRIDTSASNGVYLVVENGIIRVVAEHAFDQSTVAEVITGASAGVVTPGNLRGALSVGQAVDVSCEALTKAVTPTYNPDFLHDFYLEKTNATDGTYYVFGFQTAATKFPKSADDLKYLAICDFRNSGAVALQYGTGNSRLQGSGYGNIAGKDLMFIPQAACAAGQTQYTRLYCLFRGNEGLLYLQLKTAAAGTLHIDIKNWRQYEVTALTDEAIAYIAQLPDPDAFFRSSTIFQVRDKYLVKQDMVCPWIFTIKMTDNSDLTVGAGLSYKIRYTNDSPHKITVDTIPADAHGWDAHIQMFIKGTSSIVFQKPLILMDALTPNAGHNLLVKFRNGDAYVYVEDTNAGYIVTEPSGTGAGTLNFGIVDPDTDYVIFAAALDGTTVDAGTAVFGSTATTLTTLNVLGNGTDATSITGDIGAASGMTINFQDLAISGGTLSGAGTIQTINTVLDNSTFVGTGTKDIQSLTISGTCYTNGLTVNGTLYGTPDSNLLPVADTVGLINLGVAGSRIDGVRVVGATTTRRIFAYTGTIASSDTYYVDNCYFKDCVNTADYGCYFHWYTGTLVITNTTFSGGTASGSDNGGRIRNGAKLYATDCTWENNRMRGMINSPYTGPTNEVHFAGSNTLTNFHMFGVGDMYTADNTVLDLSKTTTTWGNDNALFVADVGATVSTFLGNNTTLLTPSGSTASVDACSCNILTAYGKIATGDLSNIVIPAGASNPWKAANVMFTDPIDAGAVYDLKLSGTTFTSASKTLNASRIQLPASTTVSFQGNTNAADTKILEAPVIVVGDNAASPSGSATIINAAGTASTVSGIGSYIDKEGDNDFVPLTSVSVVNTSATSGAGSLPLALTGSNKFVRITNNVVGTVGAATDAVDKTVMTNEYEPIIGGTFSLTSATVNEATKTVAIQSGGTMSIVGIRGGKDSVINGNGIITISSGAIVNLTGNINSIPINPDGGVIVDGGCTVINSAGAKVSISGGTYTQINNDGTTE